MTVGSRYPGGLFAPRDGETTLFGGLATLETGDVMFSASFGLSGWFVAAAAAASWSRLR